MGMRSDTPRSSGSNVPVMKQQQPQTILLPTQPLPQSVPTHSLNVEVAEDGRLGQDEVERDCENNIQHAVARMMNSYTEDIAEEKEDLSVSSKVLITKDNCQFSVPASSCPKYINIHFIGEISSRILFSTISWLRQLSFFSGLKHSNQRKVRIISSSYCPTLLVLLSWILELFEL